MSQLFQPSSQNTFVRGILTIAIAVLFLAVPGLTLKSVIMSIGALILISGAVSLLLPILKNKKGSRFGSSFQGFFNILLGILFLLAPMTIVEVFGFFFGIIFLLLGLTQLLAATATLSKSVWSWIYMAFSFLLIFGGIFLLVRPIESAEHILTFFGAVLLIYGFLELTMAWRIRKMLQRPNSRNVVDTTYEEV